MKQRLETSGKNIKRNRIDWDNIKITFVPANKENPNPLNPYARMTAEDREEELISICGKIWARAMKEKALLEQQRNQ